MNTNDLYMLQNFRVIQIQNIPLNEELFLVDEKWIEEYKVTVIEVVNGKPYKPVGYASYIQIWSINDTGLEASWYPNIHDRFHEIKINIPKHQIVVCLASPDYDDLVRVFVKSAWLENLFLKTYSTFAFIDAIGVKQMLNNGQLTRDKLINLRNYIDKIAIKYSNFAFISFADSLIIKSNWFIGKYDSAVKYTYNPEPLMKLLLEINTMYLEVLGLNTYSIIAQGNNEYYSDNLLHISDTKNHICLNSLGLPFAQIIEINEAVKHAIKNSIHPPAELYLEENFFNSLLFKNGSNKNPILKASFSSSIQPNKKNYYYFCDRIIILDNLDLN